MPENVVGESKDYRVRELGRSLLTLRGDLVVTPRVESGETSYVIEDPVRSQFFRVGLPEYTFISLFEGRTTISDALRLTARALPERALSEQDAAGICRWLIESGLAHTDESAQVERLFAASQTTAQAPIWARFNPLFIKVPLVYPDRYFQRLTRWLGPLHSRFGVLVGVLLGVVAAYRVGLQWDRFAASSAGILSPDRWLWLGVCWIFLKLIHEMGHGVACKRHGGAVHEAGLILILFAPLAYVDVTSTWRFRSKWPRIHTAAAGMAAELSVAAVAAIVWAWTDAGVINDLCFNVVIMASVTTLLFNANPLMRFDGYYILSDFLEIPNLYSCGAQYVRFLGRKFLLGLPGKLPPWADFTPRGLFIRVYGIAALLWRILICLFLITAAATLFHGAGIVLAVMTLLIWLGLPAAKLGSFLIKGNAWEQPNRTHFLCTLGLGAALLVALCAIVPWPGVKRAPVIVEFAPQTVVRAGSPGFVSEIFVQDGQAVRAGQPLVRLENQELTLQLRDWELAIALSELKCRTHEKNGEMAAYQSEWKTLEGLKKKHRLIQLQVEQLTVRAPAEGTVISRNLESLMGSYLLAGHEIVSIGNEEQKELRLSIAQADVETVYHYVGRPLTVRLPGVARFYPSLTKIDPTASMVPHHPSLAAAYGGPLKVQERQIEGDRLDRATEAYELLAPRFTGIVRLNVADSSRLRVGQRGVVWFGRGHQTVGRFLIDQLVSSIPDSFARQFHVRP